MGDPRRSSGSELRDSQEQAPDHTSSRDASQSSHAEESDDEATATPGGPKRELNPYSSMGRDPERVPGLMDKVLCLQSSHPCHHY